MGGKRGRPRKYDECHCGERKRIGMPFCWWCWDRLPTIHKTELMQEKGLLRDRALTRARQFLYGGAQT